MSFIIISCFALAVNEMDYFFEKKLSVKEILLYSAVLCATDTVAILNLVKE